MILLIIIAISLIVFFVMFFLILRLTNEPPEMTWIDRENNNEIKGDE